MKANALPFLRGMAYNQIDELHGKLVDIALNILEENMDSINEDAIDYVCEKIADSIIEHWDELKEADTDVYEDTKEDDVADSEFMLSEQEREICKREMLKQAIQIVIEGRRSSISHIQHQLKIGYNKVCALMEAMERYGIVSPQVGTEPRTILVDTYEEAISRLPKQN